MKNESRINYVLSMYNDVTIILSRLLKLAIVPVLTKSFLKTLIPVLHFVV